MTVWNQTCTEVTDRIPGEDKTMKRFLVALTVLIGLFAVLPVYADLVTPFTPAPGAVATPIGIDPMSFGVGLASTGPVHFSFGGVANNKNIGTVIESVRRDT